MAIADVISKLCAAVSKASATQWIATTVAAIIVTTALTLIRWTLGTLRPKNFPPGPRITPGLGNLLQMPLSKPYLTFHKWFKSYGDLVGVKVGTGNMVIINSPDIVNELFDRRGAYYSGRPYNHILSKHVFPLPEDKAVTVLQYDDYYRRWRKSLNYILGPGGVNRVTPVLEAEAANFSRLCLDGGENYIRNLHYWALAGPIAITCGKRLENLPADYTETFVHGQDVLLELITPGVAPPVDVFPILKYVPEWLGASWKAAARKVHDIHLTDRLMYLDYGKDQRARIKKDPSSIGLPCLMAKILEDQEANPNAPGFTDIELAHLGANMGGVAVDTTAVTLKSMMLLFACYPEVMRKVQAEVDRVGNGKPPTAEHLDQLVYLRACISETLRFRPTTPSALPHTLDKDDIFKGYFFTKGTVFLANAWTLNHNEEDYDRPEEWIPERFLENAYGLRPERFAPATLGSRRALYAFGSGRRICPGIDFAFTSLLLASSKILWAHDVLPPLEGVDISIETGYEDGVVTAPKNPAVLLRLRDEKRKDGIMEDFERTNAVARSLIP
ncbi:cytochrome P450 [Periconia macrospinosa]|uniref:Cytochrome P450 n=1 Tax=Periconia macrospinosa TaxID=97972 RepID=A0A2V1DRA3_9PLEO|nr:cytochrome P450 [Periconia macrospinosa]